MAPDFVWRDGDRTVVLRRDGVAVAPQLLTEYGFSEFELLSTPRALAAAGELAAEARTVHEVGPGQVPDLAASLLNAVGPGPLVALGGGRPIDVAKAIAAVGSGIVAAIPTTMSGAEMTGIHRLPAGAESRASGLVRPRLVIADPEAMTAQPETALRASSMNALAHGADSLYTPFANPLAKMAAVRGAALIAGSLDQVPADRDRAALATGSLLCGYAIDSGRFGLHHVVCQTLVRVCGSPHAETNAAILPRALALLEQRAPEQLGALAAAIGAGEGELEARVSRLGGNPAGLGGLGADRSRLDDALTAMLDRPELAFVPGPILTRDDLAELVGLSW